MSYLTFLALIIFYIYEVRNMSYSLLIINYIYNRVDNDRFLRDCVDIKIGM